LTGTLNFAVTNSVGAFFILTGIALVYARTGALNMAQMGETLVARSGGGPDALVIGAFTLMAVGFFCKAAVVPFHFWLADAYAVSPTPVCLLLSAVMSELGLYAFARVYWTVFSGVLGGAAEAITVVLLVAGTLTAIVGAAMCFAQRHLKRLLAFATVSHVGLFLIGIALLSPSGLAGTAIYVLADGAVKASLFVGVGVIQHRYASVDELALRGRGRDLPITAGVVVLGGLALASLPPFGPFLGKSMIEHAASETGHAWVAIVFVVASALTGGAVLRSAGRIFLGLGSPDERYEDKFSFSGEEADPEAAYPRSQVPRPMTVTAIALLAGGLALGLVPGLAEAAMGAAARFVDRQGYVATVLGGAPVAAIDAPPWAGLEAKDWLIAVLSMGGAIALAGVALARGPLHHLVGGATGRRLRDGVALLRSLHSGHVGDYVTWVVVGAVTLGAVWAASIG
jgi:multicomponent Na+:H+ antiporter subunit D